MAKFYWIGLKLNTDSGPVYEVKGAYNTQVGRDSELVKNSQLWNASGIEVKPFETEGKKKDEALSLAKQILDAPVDTPTPVTQPVESEQAGENNIPSMSPVQGLTLEEEASNLGKSTFGDDLMDGSKSLEEVALMEGGETLGKEVTEGSEEEFESSGSLLESAESLRKTTLDLEADKADKAFEADTRDARQELFGEDEEEVVDKSGPQLAQQVALKPNQ